MNIDPKSNMFGLPSMQVRQVLRQFPFSEDCGYGWQAATRVVKSDEIAQKLILDLVCAGLLGEVRFNDQHVYYSRTDEGNRLAMASARTMKRATAEKKLRELLARCRSINSDSRYCYFVPRVIVFGSFVGNKDPIGDLDVAFERADRYSRKGLVEGRGPMHDAWRASRERAPGHVSGIDLIFWPETEFRKALKAGSSGLSLHDFDSDKKAVLSGPHYSIFFPEALRLKRLGEEHDEEKRVG